MYSVIKVTEFLPNSVVENLFFNTIEQKIAFKVVERLHQDQWQFRCHQIWCKVTLVFTTAYALIMFMCMRYRTEQKFIRLKHIYLIVTKQKYIFVKV